MNTSGGMLPSPGGRRLNFSSVNNSLDDSRQLDNSVDGSSVGRGSPASSTGAMMRVNPALVASLQPTVLKRDLSLYQQAVKVRRTTVHTTGAR